ncbi:hypothetical protein RND71_038206 [Anisodus tanguticus]|uniref:Uncharacterized protein n=1 Tax=Anisodus tanguticus TaxID=243964 RepID=A0AAE1QZ93_9SOLA|nr:hypothetical protein RND71_038206 [Anisodus tanguticus]
MDKSDSQDVSSSHEGTKADALGTCNGGVIVEEQKNGELRKKVKGYYSVQINARVESCWKLLLYDELEGAVVTGDETRLRRRKNRRKVVDGGTVSGSLERQNCEVIPPL